MLKQQRSLIFWNDRLADKPVFRCGCAKVYLLKEGTGIQNLDSQPIADMTPKAPMYLVTRDMRLCYWFSKWRSMSETASKSLPFKKV